MPTDFASLEAAARRASSARAWAYVAGGAGEGGTMRNNRQAFDRWVTVPRMAHGVGERDLSATVLGTRLASPLLRTAPAHRDVRWGEWPGGRSENDVPETDLISPNGLLLSV